MLPAAINSIARFFLFLVPILLCACSTTRHVQMQVAEHISKDTIFLSNVQYDSIYVLQDKYTDRRKDTLLIKETNIEYRYKLLRDTIRFVRCDSIPYEVRIIETKEVHKPPNTFDYLCYLSFGILLGIVLWKFYHVIKFL